MSFPRASQALSRFTVLDLTRVRSGPTCVRQLADWGANVIKIETPPHLEKGEGPGGPRENADFQNLHRNKRSMTLDLKSPEGVAAFRRMVAKADVVVENFRPDVKNRLGINYEDLKKINKGIVLGSISGFGQDGPYAKRPGFDQIAQGLGGLMSITGLPGQGPVRVGIPIADLTAGLFCAMGIMTALLEREVSGKGQWVQSSLLQAGIALLDFQAARYVMKGEVPPQMGNDHPTSMPTSAYKTSDGYINVACSGDGMWKRLCNVIGREDMLAMPEFKTNERRSENRGKLNAILNDVFATGPSGEWVETLNKAGVPCGPIYKMDQVFADPQVRHMEATSEVSHPRLGKFNVLSQAIRLSRTPAKVTSATPEQGQHTDEILQGLGYKPDEISALRSKGAI
jgi:crotonobetainyl-CoA:carnitine CoA-transferase CaiB-like acyl-CoA transferase